MRVKKERIFTGFISDEVQPHELRGREISRKAAAEGMVLLKNEGHILPLLPEQPIALYGGGATRTVKGGTGAGDVNERHTVTVYEGLKNAGYCITSGQWLQSYEECYQKARQEWKEKILEKEKTAKGFGFFDAYSQVPFYIPEGPEIDLQTAADDIAKTAIYVLPRIAGEGCDRDCVKGDYLLSDSEQKQLEALCLAYENVVLLINSGALVDLSILDQWSQIKAVLYCGQPGMEAGNAIADILSGRKTPSGKLTDSIPFAYGDYTHADTFSHRNGNTEQEFYEEGIYVGYRYFDSFDKKVRYPFGYGLSYTDFQVELKDIRTSRTGIGLEFSLEVRNTGKTYAGKEVVQIYAQPSQEGMEKEKRRLVAFGKTKLLLPGESEVLEVTLPFERLTSFSEADAAWILDQGWYGLEVGTSLENARPVCKIEVPQERIVQKVTHICPLQQKLTELHREEKVRLAAYMDAKKQLEVLPTFTIPEGNLVQTAVSVGDEETKEAQKLVETFSTEQKVRMVVGDPDAGEENLTQGTAAPDQVGGSSISVPGAAADTSSCADREPWNIPAISTADGPAGLRLNRTYQVKDGQILYQDFKETVEGGIFAEDKAPEGTVYHQYCSAFPVGTVLAQSFDMDLIREVGKTVGEEMNLFQISLWLAPGMNIHRNPLCGRNFEYYSEDPLVSGMAAAAMTEGVQSVQGCGVTIKHFACNNQEDNRLNVDSVLSERALREIYLKGFEIAIKEAQPAAIMTSYNLVNGVHTANSYDLCTTAAREEWGFEGLIMTDWLTTSDITEGECTAAGCVRAGNDLVMPGIEEDLQNIRNDLESGALSEEKLQESAVRVVRAVLRSNRWK